MANDAAKKNAKAWALWIKILGTATVVVTLLFAYFGLYGNENFGTWSWVAYAIILLTYWFAVRQVLHATKEGLPRPEMWFDALFTAYVANLLMIFSPWLWWILLWVPVHYGYKAFQQIKNMASMAGMGSSMGLDGAAAGQNTTKKRKKKKRKY